MKFIAQKTDDGKIRGKISFYCKALNVSRQGFYKYLRDKDRPYKYEALVRAMKEILATDECNDTYGKVRMREALMLYKADEIDIPSESTLYRIMKENGLSHKAKRKPNGLTKADKNARKSEDLLRREFGAEKPLVKSITDITEIKTKEGKLYLSVIFDCYDLTVLGIAMDTNMKALLCVKTLENAAKAYNINGMIVHSDRGSQYTSKLYREAIATYGVKQSMNSDGGRCHDNARCESMWARMKSELLYDRYDTKTMNNEEVKTLIWRYFMSYWNNRRICSAIGGIPPIIKRNNYYKYNNIDIAA